MPDSLAALLRERLGAETFVRTNALLSQVGTTAARMLAQDPQRVGFIVVNLSANLVYVGPFGNPSATRGILVGPNGGNVIARWQEDLSVVGYEWWAVADAAASDVLVMEYILVPQPEGV